MRERSHNEYYYGQLWNSWDFSSLPLSMSTRINPRRGLMEHYIFCYFLLWLVDCVCIHRPTGNESLRSFPSMLILLTHYIHSYYGPAKQSSCTGTTCKSDIESLAIMVSSLSEYACKKSEVQNTEIQPTQSHERNVTLIYPVSSTVLSGLVLPDMVIGSRYATL